MFEQVHFANTLHKWASAQYSSTCLLPQSLQDLDLGLKCLIIVEPELKNVGYIYIKLIVN